MRVKLIRIGNSYGVRLPKAIIRECEIKSDMELLVSDKKIILSSDRLPRGFWKEDIQEKKAQNKELMESEWKW